jgi:hypothetical protein
MSMTKRVTPAAPKAALWLGACVVAVASITAGNAQTRPPADRQDAALAYAQCMRENGFTEFPDPSPDGRMRMQVTGESAPRFQAAQVKCRQLAPEGLAEGGISPENLEALVRLAECVRKNGVPKFPDPDAEGRLNFAAADLDPENPRLQAAMKTCSSDGVLARGGGRIIVTR